MRRVSDLFADSVSVFSATAGGTAAFGGPQLPALFHGAFFHSAAEPGGITLETAGPNLIGVIINGGDDTLGFIPEPGPFLLLLGGIPAVLVLRRKR